MDPLKVNTESAPSTLPPQESLTFKESFVKQIKEVRDLYVNLFLHPHWVIYGAAEVVKNLAYDMPRSLLTPKDPNVPEAELNPEQKLSLKSTQAFVLSELVAIPSTYAGVLAFQSLGADDFSASMIGSAVGNYMGGVIGYISSYLALSRGVKGYTFEEALKDSVRLVRNLAPLAASLYAADAPILGGLIASGFTPNQAVTAQMIVGATLFAGVAKNSAKKTAADSVEKEDPAKKSE